MLSRRCIGSLTSCRLVWGVSDHFARDQGQKLQLVVRFVRWPRYFVISCHCAVLKEQLKEIIMRCIGIECSKRKSPAPISAAGDCFPVHRWADCSPVHERGVSVCRLRRGWLRGLMSRPRQLRRRCSSRQRRPRHSLALLPQLRHRACPWHSSRCVPERCADAVSLVSQSPLC